MITNFFNEYNDAVYDLTENQKVMQMNLYIQHSDVTTFRHCLHVSILSYFICRKLCRFNFNAKNAARGGLLHDMFLYDWHDRKKEKIHGKPHGFVHPTIALLNAKRYTNNVNSIESDIIINHMWPLTIYRLPKYKETYVVSAADKICALLEVMKFINISMFNEVDKMYSYKKFKKTSMCE